MCSQFIELQYLNATIELVLAKSIIEICQFTMCKCKYVLYHLNMLKLFQEINMFFCFESKLVSNKNFSLKYLIQGFNPHLFSLFNVYPL